MKPRHLFTSAWMLAALFLANTAGQAQNQVMAQIIVPQPVPVSVPELLGRTGETVLVLTNLHPTKTFDVMFGATVTGNNGISGSMDPLKKKPSRPITLKPGQPVMLTGDEILNIFSNFSIFDIEYEGIDLEDLLQNPLFPEGRYIDCVTVYDYDTGEQLSASKPMNCSVPITVRTPGPPIIQFPLNNATVEYNPFVPITFRWTAVTQPGQMFFYRFRMVEVPQGVSAYDAIESDNFLVYSEENIPANLLLYDLTKPNLPAGNYAVQVTAYDPMGQGFIKNEGKSNVHVFKIKPPVFDPPVVLGPADQQILPFTIPMDFGFNWTAPANPTETVLYRLRLVEVPLGKTPAQAINDNSLLVFQENGLAENQFRYTGQQLGPGKTYVARVQAYDSEGQMPFRNNGYSQLRVFSVGLPGGDVNDDNSTDTTDIIALTDFLCGQGCSPDAPENQTPGGSLHAGDRVKIGHFFMQVNSVTGSPGSYRGAGIMLPTDFFPMYLGVTFSNLSVNSSQEALAGRADVRYDPSAPTSDWLYSPGEVDNQGQYQRYIQNNAPNIFDLALLALTGVPLPLKVGTADKYFILNKGHYTPEGAFFDLAAMMPLQGDMFEGEKVAFFGAQNVCFSPGGLGIGVETLRLELLKDLVFSPTDSYTLQLFAEQQGNSSTFASIDCDGVTSVHLEGYVAFSRERIVPMVNGQPSPDKRLAARFLAEVTDYSDILGGLTFQAGRSQQLSINNSVLTNSFYLTNLMHYSFQLNTGWLDLSDFANPANMALPPGMAAVDDTWRGIYANNFSVFLPKWMKNTTANQSRQASFNGQFFLLDQVGVTVVGEGSSVIVPGAGSLGGWSFHIQDFEINLVQNQLNRIAFSGGIRLPVSEGFVNYDALGVTQNGVLNYEFHARNLDEVRIPMWYGNFNLDANSFIALEINYGTGPNGLPLPNFNNPNLPGNPLNFYDNEDLAVKLNSHLSGRFRLDEAVGPVKNVNIHHLRIENLQVRNSPNYLSSGQIDFAATAGIRLDDLGLHGFALPLDADVRVSIDSLGPLLTQLRIHGKLNLDGLLFGIRAETALRLQGQMTLLPSQNWTTKEVIVDDAVLDFSAGPLTLRGRARAYFNDAVYGDGYRGTLSAHFFGIEELGADLVQSVFGNKIVNGRGREFWYVQTNTIPLGINPIPLFTPYFGLYGFSLAAYYNMSKEAATRTNDPLNKLRFVPDASNHRRYGFAGNVLAGTMFPNPSAQVNRPDLLNGEVELRVDFNQSWSFSRVDLEGDMFLLRTPPSLGGPAILPSDGIVRLNGLLSYDHNAGAFSGSFGYDIRIPGFGGSSTSQRIVEMYFGNDMYYVNVGTPVHRINLPFSESFSILGKTVNLGLDVGTYLSLGYRNPALANFPPPLPQVVLDACRSCRTMDRSEGMSEVRGGTGVAAGFHALFNPPPIRGVLDLGWAGTHGLVFDMNAAAGVDFAVVNMEGFNCNGSNSYGIYNYYGRGRGYVHGGASLDFVIFGDRYNGIGINVGSVLNIATPNPTGIRADVYATLSVGPFDIDFNERFTLGSICQFNSNPEDNLEQLRSRVAQLKLVESVNFEENSEQSYNGGFQPAVDFVFKPDYAFTMDYGGATISYRARLDNVRLRKQQGNTWTTVVNVPHVLNNKNLRYGVEAPLHLLDPNSTYQASFRLTLEIFKNNAWRKVQDDDGEDVILNFSRSFRTERAPDRIENPVSLIPRWGQRYFHWQDVVAGHVQAPDYRIASNWDLSQYKVVAKFTNLRSGTSQTVDATINVQESRFSYPVSQLTGGKLYRLDLLVVSRNPNNNFSHELYSYVFQTSFYATMQAKVNAMTIGLVEEHPYTAGRTGETISSDDFTITFRCDEGIEQYEWDAMKFLFNSNVRNSATRDWIIYRGDVENAVIRHGTGFPSSQEFIAETTGSLVEGNIIYVPNFGPPPPPSRSTRDVLKIRWRPDKRVFYSKQRVKQYVPIGNLSSAERALIYSPYRLLPRNAYRIRLQCQLLNDDAYIEMRGFAVNLSGI